MSNLSSKERDRIYESIILNNWNAIVFANMEGVVELVNPAANKLYGYEDGELVGQHVDIFNSHLTHNTEEIVNSIIEKGYWHGELIQRRKDNSTFDALLHVQLINDMNGNPLGYASNSKDITSDKESAKKLKQTIKEKEVLLRELHHRVKNNISTIKGILNLQLGTADQNDPTRLLSDFQNRLNVLVEAHHNISLQQDTQEIDLSVYLSQIIGDVVKLFGTQKSEIEVDEHIEQVFVPMDIAIPIGLITNELVTNAFKHAFHEGGKLDVSLKVIDQGDKMCQLEVRDDGPGFEYSEEMLGSSLGLSLVDGLVNQLNGEYEFKESTNGTYFSLIFKCPKEL